MKEDQKINLICRMAGNIYGKHPVSSRLAIKLAFEIFEEVEKRVKEVSKSDTNKGNKK